MEEKNAADPVPTKPASLVGTIIKWAILALLLFTCFMAAYRKFGG
jgi:hypothetical protein